MKKAFSLFALSILIISHQAHCMYYPLEGGVMYVDERGGQIFYPDQRPFQEPIYYPIYQAYYPHQIYPAYYPWVNYQPMSYQEDYPTDCMQDVYETEIFQPQLQETQTNSEVKFDEVRHFFEEILNHQEFLSFGKSLIQNSRKNDEIKLVDKGAHFTNSSDCFLEGPVKKINPTPPNLKDARNLKDAILKIISQYTNKAQDRLNQLFCNPLTGNNLIQLSHVAFNNLNFSSEDVEVICILSLALFTDFKTFNGIDRLRWAVKKNLYTLVEKTLNENIHPNWVVENCGTTALQMSLIHHNQSIAELLLDIPDIDVTTPNHFGNTALELAQKYRLEDVYITIEHKS